MRMYSACRFPKRIRRQSHQVFTIVINSELCDSESLPALFPPTQPPSFLLRVVSIGHEMDVVVELRRFRFQRLVDEVLKELGRGFFRQLKVECVAQIRQVVRRLL